MLPRVALVDPLLASGCSAHCHGIQWARCADPVPGTARLLSGNTADRLTHQEGLRRAAAGLRTAYQDGSNVAARTDMALCSLLGGLALANAKLGAVHGFAAVIGGGVAAHTARCAPPLLAAVVEVNVCALRQREQESPVLDRYVDAARILTGRPAATIEDGIEAARDRRSAEHSRSRRPRRPARRCRRDRCQGPHGEQHEVQPDCPHRH